MKRHLAVMILLIGGRAGAAPPVTAIAYDDKSHLALGVGRVVVLVDSANGKLERRLTELPGPVTALAWHGSSIAIAAGLPGQPGIVRVISTASGQSHEFPGHADAVYGLAFSGDGKQLATAGYDKLVKLWDAVTGREIQTLKDHSDAVYGLAWHDDLIATCAADRTVKIWHAKTGKRLYSLTDPTDWLYAVAFSPDGKHVAAGGVDKSIRVWEVGENEGKLISSYFAHEGPILRLCFAPDGRSLYSLSEDRTIKSWDWRKGAELRQFPKLTGDAMTLALRYDSKQLAVGRHDGTLTFHDSATGKVTATLSRAQLIPPPRVMSVSPSSIPRGSKARIELSGQDLNSVTKVTCATPGIEVRLADVKHSATSLTVDVAVAATTIPGNITLTIKSPDGDATAELAVDWFVEVKAVEGKPCRTDATIAGHLTRPGDVGTFVFELKEKQELGATVTTPGKSKLEAVMQLSGPDGRTLADGGTALGFVAPTAGEYRITVRDRDFRGGANYGYRLHVGAIPVVTGVFPLGLQRGQSVRASLLGVNLPTREVQVTAPSDAMVGAKLSAPIAGALGKAELIVGEFTETAAAAKPLPVPGTGNGIIKSERADDTWTFSAKAGQRLIVEALARRYGSPLDPMIEILDANGKSIEQARVQCVAKTVAVLRDVPAKEPNIRLESWNEYATDDLVLVGQELIKIEQLPGHPDADCAFYSVDGGRQTYFGTTPALHPLGVPIYRVKVHPPHTELAANGYPVVPLYYRNDDGGPGYGKDARLFFTAPKDGEFRVRITDARGFGGELYAYRLTVRPPKPDFTLKLGSANPTIARRQAVALAVTAERRDGCDGPIRVRLDNLPAGFTSPPTMIEAGHTRSSLIISAASDAVDPPADAKFTLVGESPEISLRHEYKQGRPKIGDAGDIVTHLEQAEVRVRPGQETTLRVRIERKNGFAGRVPLEMRGLPHGVRVLHIGLNGILITEKESARTIALYAEPWVAPGDYPIAVLAKREGKNTEHAAPPISLKVEK